MSPTPLLNPRPLVLACALLWATAIFAMPAPVHAGVPAAIPLQGYLSDAEGKPVAGSTRVQFVLYAGQGAQAVVLSTHTEELAVDNGLFSTYLPVVNMTIFRDHPDVSLGITVGEDAEMSPRIALGSVPYAMVAAHAFSADAADFATQAEQAETAIFATLAERATTADKAELATDASMLGGRVASDYALATSVPVLTQGFEGLEGAVGVSTSFVRQIAQDACFDTSAEVVAALGNTYMRTPASCEDGQGLRYVENSGTWVCANLPESVRYEAAPNGGLALQDNAFAVDASVARLDRTQTFSERVDFSGDIVAASEYRYLEARTRLLRLPPESFLAEPRTVTQFVSSTVDASGASAAFFGNVKPGASNNSPTVFSAPLTLPDEAVIQGIGCYIANTDATSAVFVAHLMTQSISNSNIQASSQHSYSKSVPNEALPRVTLADSLLVTPVTVATAQNSYRLQTTLTPSNAAATNSVRFYGCYVEYQVLRVAQ